MQHVAVQKVTSSEREALFFKFFFSMERTFGNSGTRQKWVGGWMGGRKEEKNPHAARRLRFLSMFSLVMEKALCVEPQHPVP